MDLAALITGKNLLLMAGCFALTTVARKSAKPFFDAGIGERLLPLLPLLFGVLGALMGVCENAPTVGDKVVMGLIAGFAASHMFKLGKTTVMGFGVAPKKKKAKPLPEEGTEPEPAPEDPAEGKE